MNLSISQSEWSVLFRNLVNGNVNSFTAHNIIEEHKEILNEFKEKLKQRKLNAVEKYKKELEEKAMIDMKNKILKFESKQEEKIEENFKNKFYNLAQDIGGRR